MGIIPRRLRRKTKLINYHDTPLRVARIFINFRPTLKLTFMSKTTDFLEVIKWMDKQRWNSINSNPNFNNDIYTNLPPHGKILVHWLSYITDRATSYERVWTKGINIFSGIVYKYLEVGYDKILCDEYFTFKPDKNEDIKIKFSNGIEDYASRFVSTDLKSVLLTLKILEYHGRNILKYLCDKYYGFTCLKKSNKIEENNPILLSAFILNNLTYAFVHPNKSENKPDTLKKYIDKTINNYDNFENIHSNKDKFQGIYIRFVKERFTGNKRLWCSIRDYLKCKHFRDPFIESLTMIDTERILLKAWQDENNLFFLELPGDVWNLNHDFVNYFIKSNLGITSINSIPKRLREEINKINNNNKYYPELFDFSFDFVPRMCADPENIISRKMCNICFFNKDKTKSMLEYCIKNKDMNCPLVFIACKYKVKCDPDECKIKSKDKTLFCKGINH